jgi:hypothetical protein
VFPLAAVHLALPFWPRLDTAKPVEPSVTWFGIVSDLHGH